LIFLSIFLIVTIIHFIAANHRAFRFSFLFHFFLFWFWSYRRAILLFVPLFSRLRVIKGRPRAELVGWSRGERELLVRYLALLENVRSDWLHYYIFLISFGSILISSCHLRSIPLISIGDSILLIVVLIFILDPRRTVLLILSLLCLYIKLELFLMLLSYLHLFFFFQYIFSCSVFISLQRVISFVAQLDFTKN
jgi:hypothetical protein